MDKIKFLCTEPFLTKKWLGRSLRWLLSGHRFWVVRTLAIDLEVKDNIIKITEPEKTAAALKALTGSSERWAMQKIEDLAIITPCHVYVWRGPFHIEVKAETELGHYGYESCARTMLMEIICNPINFFRAVWLYGRQKAGGKIEKPTK